MSLQGSIHKWSDGIGYGAYVPPERVYYNDRKPTSKRLRRASSERTNYRRQNATAGVDTHRSDISFGKTLDSIKTGEEGNSRAREATTFLTSGEVVQFIKNEEFSSFFRLDVAGYSSSMVTHI